MTLPFTRVLLTGGDGFVGRTLGPLLAASLGPDVRVIACGTAQGAWATEWTALDLTDATEVRALIAREQPDLVVHLAARSSVAESTNGVAESWRVNLGGSLNLGEAIAADAPTATILFVSSAEVYGSSFNDGPCDEATPPRPLSPYAWTKVASEALLAQLLGPDNRLIVARPANHTGPEQDTRFVIPSFAEQIARAEAGLQPAVVRVGNLLAERDFLSVNDVAAAYLSLLTHASSLPSRSVFNIASGRLVAVSVVLDRLLALGTLPIEVEIDPTRQRPTEVQRAAIATEAITVATGWRPRTDLDTLLRAVLDARRHQVAAARNLAGAP